MAARKIRKRKKHGKTSPPDVFFYDDFKKYLSDYFAYRKKNDRSFSYRSFSRMIGMTYHSYLQDIMNGKRDLSIRMAKKIAKAMKLNEREAYHFGMIVSMESAVKMEYIEATRKDPQVVNSHIWALATLADFQPDPKWISEITGGIITQNQAKKSLHFLITNKFLILRKGKWKTRDKGIHVRSKSANFRDEYYRVLMNYYRKVFEQAEGSKRLFVLNTAIPPEAAERIFEEMNALLMRGFRKEQKKAEKDSAKNLHSFMVMFSDGVHRTKKRSSYL